MSELRIIKKYPNRRLYDCGRSRYITLADVYKLVEEGVDFNVVDANETDITCKILLQAVVKQEESGRGTLNRRFLTRLIRSNRGS